ncbi:MAG TPA: methionyl-tRNA formyltransferase, partial [Pseudonocardiaceae bacterium]|nr:methionyl-tRNA formyltransferase [Pseudonocardiaceae bacterium]
VAERCYGGTPGRIVIRNRTGVIVVAGPDAHRGRNQGLVIERVRTDDDTEHPADEYFSSTGGYLTRHP